jgi:hypothetical protein
MKTLIAISTLVSGFCLGAWWVHQSGSSEPSESPVVASNPTPIEREPSMPGRAQVDMSTLRALIKEEMTAVLAAKSGNDHATAPAVVGAPVSAETLAERREAQEQIGTLIAQGVWGNEQRQNFQQKLVMLDPEQRERALQDLTTGINNGTIQVNTDGPPL